MLMANNVYIYVYLVFKSPGRPDATVQSLSLGDRVVGNITACLCRT